MNIYLVLSLCFVPYILVFLIGKFVFKMKVLSGLFASLMGLIIVVPICFVQFGMPELFNHSFFSKYSLVFKLFIECLILNGILEEGIKACIIFTIPKKTKSLKEFFACCLVLGFCLGCFESSVYFLNLLQNAQSRGAELLYDVLFLRMITSDMIHGLCAGLSGIFVWSIKEKRVYIMPLLYSIVIHAMYNFFASCNGNIKYFSYAVIIFALIECRVKYMKFAVTKEVKEQHKIKVKIDDKTLTDSVL